MACGKGKGPCPADIEHRLNEYSENTKILVKIISTLLNKHFFLRKNNYVIWKMR